MPQKDTQQLRTWLLDGIAYRRSEQAIAEEAGLSFLAAYNIGWVDAYLSVVKHIAKDFVQSGEEEDANS